MALTKVTGHVIKSDTNIISHNINSSGIITAVTFDGNVSGVAVTFTGDSTIGSLGITTNLTVGGNIDVDGQTNLDHVSIAGVTTVTGEIKIPDLSGSSNKISLGTNQNLQIYYDSSSYITNGTAGHLFLKTLNGGSDIRLEANDDIFLLTAGGTRNSIICRDYAQVELYYNNTKRFETTNTGAVVSGILTVTGNMNVEGVLTYQDVTNIDSIGIITARSNIDCNGSLDVDGHTDLDNVSISGVTTITSAAPELHLTDTNANSDYSIVVNGGQFRVRDETNSANRLAVNSDGHVDIYGRLDAIGGFVASSNSSIEGNLELTSTYPSLTWTDTNHNSDFRITNDDGKLIVYDITRSAHVMDFLANGDVRIRNDKGLYIGEGNDLLVAHDGSLSRISDTFGHLKIASNIIEITNQSLGENYIKCTNNAAVDLYYDNAVKLTTSATGITVTGEVAATQDYPNFRPVLDFNFAAVKKLDPRITYQRTGAASFINEFGKIVLVGDNAPRFDHDIVTRESKGLLIEEARTNLALYSDMDMDSIGSSYYNNVTLSRAEGPDGVADSALQVTFTAAGSSFVRSGIIPCSAGVEYTFSVWIKKVSGSFNNSFFSYPQNASAGLFNNSGFVNTEGQSLSAMPTGVWKRFTQTRTTASGTTGMDFVMPAYDSNGATIQYYGLQMEAGAFATSYIPSTDGSSTARGADQTYIDGDDFLDFYNQLESTVLSHITPLNGSLGNHSGTGGVVWSFDAGGGFGNGNYLSNSNSTTAFGHSVVIGSSGQNTGGGTGNMTNGVPFKNATVFKKDDFIMATNGTLASADTSGNLPTVVKLVLGNNGWGNALNAANIHLNQFAYYPKRLPNSQLVTLTS